MASTYPYSPIYTYLLLLKIRAVLVSVTEKAALYQSIGNTTLADSYFYKAAYLTGVIRCFNTYTGLTREDLIKIVDCAINITGVEESTLWVDIKDYLVINPPPIPLPDAPVLSISLEMVGTQPVRRLSWTQSISGEQQPIQNFILYRSIDGAAFTTINPSILPTATAFDDYSMSQGLEYQYYLVAKDIALQLSPDSNIVSLTVTSLSFDIGSAATNFKFNFIGHTGKLITNVGGSITSYASYTGGLTTQVITSGTVPTVVYLTGASTVTSVKLLGKIPILNIHYNGATKIFPAVTTYDYSDNRLTQTNLDFTDTFVTDINLENNAFTAGSQYTMVQASYVGLNLNLLLQTDGTNFIPANIDVYDDFTSKVDSGGTVLVSLGYTLVTTKNGTFNVTIVSEAATYNYYRHVIQSTLISSDAASISTPLTGLTVSYKLFYPSNNTPVSITANNAGLGSSTPFTFYVNTLPPLLNTFTGNENNYQAIDINNPRVSLTNVNLNKNKINNANQADFIGEILSGANTITYDIRGQFSNNTYHWFSFALYNSLVSASQDNLIIGSVSYQLLSQKGAGDGIDIIWNVTTPDPTFTYFILSNTVSLLDELINTGTTGDIDVGVYSGDNLYGLPETIFKLIYTSNNQITSYTLNNADITGTIPT